MKKQYDIDFEIKYAILKGKHTFSEILSEVNSDESNQKIGCRNTLSSHLEELVKMKYIKKDEKIKHRPKYHLTPLSNFLDADKGIIGILNKKISTIEESSKNIPDKKLLKEFVDDTQDLLIVLSQINFSNISILNDMKRHKRQDKPNSTLGLNEKVTELINKLINMRINILEKRDKEIEEKEKYIDSYLSISFTSSILGNLQNQLSKN